MNITLGQLKAAESALKKLLNYDLPVSMSYNLRKLVKAADDEFQHYEAERVKLVTKYGKDTEDGGKTVDPEKMNDFRIELGALLELPFEVTTTGIDTDKLLDSDVKMSAVEMLALEPFFKV